MDERELAFAAFEAERPEGQEPLSGWERTVFMKGWEAARAKSTPVKRRRWF